MNELEQKIRLRNRRSRLEPQYIEGQRLLVEAMKYLVQQNPVENKAAVMLLSEHFRLRFRASDPDPAELADPRMQKRGSHSDAAEIYWVEQVQAQLGFTNPQMQVEEGAARLHNRLVDEIQARFVEDTSADSVMTALENPQYDWRTVRGIAEEIGISEGEVERALANFGDLVVHTSDEDGRSLYTTRKYYDTTHSLGRRFLSAIADTIK